jgi:hypothetical protein
VFCVSANFLSHYKYITVQHDNVEDFLEETDEGADSKVITELNAHRAVDMDTNAKTYSFEVSYRLNFHKT